MGKTIVARSKRQEENPDARLTFTINLHEYLRENVLMADQKAAFMLAAVLTTIAFMSQKGTTRILTQHHQCIELTDILTISAILSLLISAIFSIIVVIPRTRGYRAENSIIYWNAIAKSKDSQSYAGRVSELPLTTLVDAKLEHCFELAKICQRKFRFAKIALWWGTYGLIAATVRNLLVN